MTALTDGLTFDLPNFVGELYHTTPTITPFLSMIGGETGGVPLYAKEFGWQTDTNPAAAQPDIVEFDEPVYDERARADVVQVPQIFQYGFRVSYTKMATPDQLGSGGASPATPAQASILGNQPVRSELQHQGMLKAMRAARDMEYTFLNGVFVHPNSNASARRTRGVITATTTNAVAASSAALSKTHIDSVLRAMADAGAPMTNVVLFANSLNKQRISEAYGYAPENRNVGGVNIKQIETDFAIVGVVYDRFVPAATVAAIDVAYCRPRHLLVPDKGFLFAEPMAKTHAGEQYQLYGEAAIEYGPEQWHGKITGLATT